jgi:HTH-type transcriptional regulator / antitoxin HigA
VSEAKRNISPIRDEASHLAALAEIERLWGAAPGTSEGDRLDVLVVLVDEYERRTWPDEDLDPVDAIVARMENSGRDRKDLEKIVGSSGRVSEILNRRRHLTLPMIWRLVQEWKMPAEVLIRPYKLSAGTDLGREQGSEAGREAAEDGRVVPKTCDTAEGGIARLRGRDKRGMTTDELMRLTRGEDTD